MRKKGKRGTPKPITYAGKHYPSHAALARVYGLCPRQIQWRVKQGYTDKRLITRYLRGDTKSPKTPRSPMWIQTSFGWWKV